jgi:hypothetical protein
VSFSIINHKLITNRLPVSKAVPQVMDGDQEVDEPSICKPEPNEGYDSQATDDADFHEQSKDSSD